MRQAAARAVAARRPRREYPHKTRSNAAVGTSTRARHQAPPACHQPATQTRRECGEKAEDDDSSGAYSWAKKSNGAPVTPQTRSDGRWTGSNHAGRPPTLDGNRWRSREAGGTGSTKPSVQPSLSVSESDDEHDGAGWGAATVVMMCVCVCVCVCVCANVCANRLARRARRTGRAGGRRCPICGGAFLCEGVDGALPSLTLNQAHSASTQCTLVACHTDSGGTGAAPGRRRKTTELSGRSPSRQPPIACLLLFVPPLLHTPRARPCRRDPRARVLLPPLPQPPRTRTRSPRRAPTLAPPTLA